MSAVPPNMRVQRTRSSASPPHSPLTRGPLGTRGILVAMVAFALVAGAACKDSPTQPSSAQPLTGQWVADMSGQICVGDWSRVTLSLVQTGLNLAGQLTTRDGQVFMVSGSLENDRGTLAVAIPGVGECAGISLGIAGVDRAAGRPTRFFGEATGRCCNTIVQSYSFMRTSGA